jgi:hypothetical protein
VKADQTGHPIPKKPAHRSAADPRVVADVTLAVTDVVHQTGDLEFQILRGQLRQDIGALQTVIDLT